MFSETTKHSLIELRRRLIYCLISYFILFATFFYSAHNIFDFLSDPLLQFLPKNSSLVATQVTTPVLMPINLALNLAIFFNLPFIFLNLWLFIAPGLYPNEKKYIIPLFITSLILFTLGVLFSYYFVLPLMFSIFVTWLPSNVNIMTDINNYLDFIFNIFLIFGIVFQIPLIIIILTKLNIITYQSLINYRSYFVIIAFIISMLLTPPDVMSMIMLAVPICLLYELGIILARINFKQKKISTKNKLT